MCRFLQKTPGKCFLVLTVRKYNFGIDPNWATCSGIKQWTDKSWDEKRSQSPLNKGQVYSLELLSGTRGKQDSPRTMIFNFISVLMRHFGRGQISNYASFPGSVMGTLGRCWAAGTTAAHQPHTCQRKEQIMHRYWGAKHVFCGFGTLNAFSVYVSATWGRIIK